MDDKIKVGFRVIGNTRIPFFLSLYCYPHWLITGSSGSGKSYCVKYLMWSLLKISDLEIFCCDFKNSGDYSFISDDHLAVGIDCAAMIDGFYKRYIAIKEANLPSKILLIFDEWAAFCLWAEGSDKKLAKETKDKISELLMMGRRLGSKGGGAFIWTILQRPDAAYFNSSRDNYFVKIVMRDVTKSIRSMLDIDADEIPPEHIALPGHGVCFTDNTVYPFIVPSYDPVAMDSLLTAERERSRKQGCT